MSLAYRILYAIGFTPWEQMADPAIATVWLLAWKPGHRGPLPRGASSEEIQAAFPEWKLTDEVPLRLPEGAPGYVRRAEPQFYRLRRD